MEPLAVGRDVYITVEPRHVVVFDVGYVKGVGVFRLGNADGLEGHADYSSSYDQC